MTTLFDPVTIGDIAAANRIVMAPLTRDRAGPGRDFLPETADIGGPVARRVGLADRRRIGVRQQ